MAVRVARNGRLVRAVSEAFRNGLMSLLIAWMAEKVALLVGVVASAGIRLINQTPYRLLALINQMRRWPPRLLKPPMPPMLRQHLGHGVVSGVSVAPPPSRPLKPRRHLINPKTSVARSQMPVP